MKRALITIATVGILAPISARPCCSRPCSPQRRMARARTRSAPFGHAGSTRLGLAATRMVPIHSGETMSPMVSCRLSM